MRARALLLLSGCFLLFLGGSASAASLSISAPPNAYVGDVITVTTSGSTEQSSDAIIRSELNGPDCAATLGDEGARVHMGYLDGRSTDAGSFTFLSQFQPYQPAVYRLCGYLYYPGDNSDTTAPRAAATTTVTVDPRPTAPVLSGKRSQRASSWITIRAACNGPCQLSAVGVIGARKLRGAGPVAGGTTATILRLRVSAPQLKSIRKSLKKHKIMKAAITVHALYPSGKGLGSRRSVTLTK
jgi:hypothetical protein